MNSQTNTLEYKSLTSEPFLYKEILEISKLILQKKSKDEIRYLCINKNYLQLTSKSAIERFMPSIMRRIEYIDEFLAEKIINESINVSKLINLYLIVKTNRLVQEFLSEIIANKNSKYKDFISVDEINKFIEKRVTDNETVAKWTELTIQKTKARLIQIMYDAGIINSKKDKEIQYVYIPEYLKEYFESIGEENFIKAINQEV